MTPSPLSELLDRARACRLCADQLEPRPVLRLSARSRILVVGQAPGSKVHASGVPWDDPSGDNLLSWLGVDRPTFEDPALFGILPMALCYPGRGASGDRPPPPICARTWHDPLTAALDGPMLTLLIGQYAQRRYLADRRGRTVADTVRTWESYGPGLLPLPHPSWRSRVWMRRNPWFEAEVLPALRERVARILSGEGARSG
jgi:uracil-DNA glycosylase